MLQRSTAVLLGTAVPCAGVELRLLGPIELVGPQGVIALGGPKERAVLAYLALHAGQLVEEGALIDVLWSDSPPRTARRTLQAYLSRLRKTFAVEGVDGSALVLESHPGGWVLQADDRVLDVARVERTVAEARAAGAAGDLLGAALGWAEAERAWRGRALAEFADAPWAVASAVHLDELRLNIVEQRIDAELACGRHQALVGELEALCAAHPLREHLWGARMTALYRSGRQAEALRVFQELRRILAEELGIDPMPELVQLEQLILEQQPSLAPGLIEPAPGSVGEPAPGSVDLPAPAALVALREQQFVGRADELATLGTAWERAAEGRLGLVLIAGEPGIGKTALAAQHALAVAEAGGVVLFGRCDEESLAPFQPFVEAFDHYVQVTSEPALRTHLGTRAADLALLVPQLGRILPEVGSVGPTGAETERYRLFEAVPAVLAALSADRPVLLVLDDLHWADGPTLQLLQHVVRRSATSRLLVVGTYRDTDLLRSHPLAESLGELRRIGPLKRILLRGLDRADVMALVAGGAAPDDADKALAEALWAETEGSPLFLREIIRHLAETEMIVQDGMGRWRPQRRLDQLGIPEGIREVIGRRLSRLSDTTNEILRAGSVLGREVRSDVLERITGVDDDRLLDGLDEAIAAGVLEEVAGAIGRFAFTHALIREALYGELSTTRRVRLHQRAGEALRAIHGAADGPHLAELAFHFGQSAVAGTVEEAVTYGRRAGDFARSVLAFEDAARHYREALEVAEDAELAPALRADLLQAIGECQSHVAGVLTARPTFERVLELVPDDPERVAAAAVGYSGESFIWLELGSPNEAVTGHLERALDVVGDADSAWRARLLACGAYSLYQVHDAAERREVLAADAVAVARRVGDPATLARVLLEAGMATYSPFNPQARVAGCREAADLAAQVGDRQLVAHAAYQSAMAFSELNDVEAAAEAFQRAAELMDETQDPMGRVMVPAAMAGWALHEGRLADALELAEVTFAHAQERGDSNALLIFSGVMAVDQYYRGTAHQIGEHLLHDAAPTFPALFPVFEAVQACLLVERAADEIAREAFGALDLTSDGPIPANAFFSFAYHIIARGCFRAGDARQAAAVYERILPIGDQSATLSNVGFGSMRTALGWCAAVMGDHELAIEHYERAMEHCRRHGWPAPLADTLPGYARSLHARGSPGDVERCRALLEEAEALGRRLEMDRVVYEVGLARHLLFGADPPAPPWDPPRRRARARTRLLARTRAVAARWTRGVDDEAIVRRFSPVLAQRTLFAAMARSYEPGVVRGLEGDLCFELLPPKGSPDSAESDWWTIEVAGARARARRGPSERPFVSVTVDIVDFIRLASGELVAFEMIADGRLQVRGNVFAAGRLAEIFGLVGSLPEG